MLHNVSLQTLEPLTHFSLVPVIHVLRAIMVPKAEQIQSLRLTLSLSVIIHPLEPLFAPKPRIKPQRLKTVEEKEGWSGLSDLKWL